MGIVDIIDKLINERAVAPILQQRLEQVKEECVRLEKDNVRLGKGKADADAKVLALEKQLHDLLQENQRIQEQLRSVQGANGNARLKVLTTMPEADYGTPPDA